MDDFGNFILEQEAGGQRGFVSGDSMPIECNRTDGKEIYEKLGFVVSDRIDDIFYSVKLPDGWRKTATEHSMWNDVLDEKGRIRLAVFYKAAFYDRNARSWANTFYTIYNDSHDYSETVQKQEGIIRVAIKNARGEETWTDQMSYTEETKYDISSFLHKLAESVADQMFPDWRNPAAYWD